MKSPSCLVKSPFSPWFFLIKIAGWSSQPSGGPHLTLGPQETKNALCHTGDQALLLLVISSMACVSRKKMPSEWDFQVPCLIKGGQISRSCGFNYIHYVKLRYVALRYVTLHFITLHCITYIVIHTIYGIYNIGSPTNNLYFLDGDPENCSVHFDLHVFSRMFAASTMVDWYWLLHGFYGRFKAPFFRCLQTSQFLLLDLWLVASSASCCLYVLMKSWHLTLSHPMVVSARMMKNWGRKKRRTEPIGDWDPLVFV